MALLIDSHHAEDSSCPFPNDYPPYGCRGYEFHMGFGDGMGGPPLGSQTAPSASSMKQMRNLAELMSSIPHGTPLHASIGRAVRFPFRLQACYIKLKRSPLLVIRHMLPSQLRYSIMREFHLRAIQSQANIVFSQYKIG